MTTNKPPTPPLGGPTIELGEAQVVTEADLDRIYGTDRTHDAPTSLVDDERNHMREDGSWDEDDAHPVPTSLMSVEDFHDTNEAPNGSAETKTLVGQAHRRRSVLRPRARNDNRAGLMLKLLIPFWFVVLAFVGLVYNAEVQSTWKFGANFAKKMEALTGADNDPGQGLAIHKQPPQREIRNGMDFFIFSGRIDNITTLDVAVPPMLIELVDGGGKVLLTQTTGLKQTMLKPGGTVPYRIEITNIPATARTANLRFATNEEAAKYLSPSHDR
ncbi:hypothetical protein V5T82_02255 [Magnetovibrio sp. PR-2]|uniref:hypothetical protein n=1 Tax=Magnetovibrio sp. PR-2 TaxID=3120356 RepID=UPI002FCE5679